MALKSTQSVRIFAAIIAITTWFALGGQLGLTLQDSSVATAEILLRYFTYFTILTNILVAVYSTLIAINPTGFNSTKTQTTPAAITVYILIVGIIYNTVLRFAWAPTGFQRIVDELLHVVVPFLFVCFWVFAVKKDLLHWKHIWLWLLYPLIYCLIILLRGNFSGWYPYPFMDVTKLGYAQVLMNSLKVTGGFFVVSAVIIGIGKSMINKIPS